jgi:hypothetical protein
MDTGPYKDARSTRVFAGVGPSFGICKCSALPVVAFHCVLFVGTAVSTALEKLN